MERYRSFVNEHGMDEHEADPTGEWVKYEPWMDEIEELANMFPEALHPRDEYKLKAKQPTICVECKNCWDTLYPKKCDISKLTYITDPNDYVCGKSGGVNLITGMPTYAFCRDKNAGNCPDFEPKQAPKDTIKDCPLTTGERLVSECKSCGNRIFCPSYHIYLSVNAPK